MIYQWSMHSNILLLHRNDMKRAQILTNNFMPSMSHTVDINIISWKLVLINQWSMHSNILLLHKEDIFKMLLHRKSGLFWFFLLQCFSHLHLQRGLGLITIFNSGLHMSNVYCHHCTGVIPLYSTITTHKPYVTILNWSY